MGGADVIRQALAAGLVDELTIIVAPVILGDGKRLFDGFSSSLDFEHLGVRQSQYATFIDYRVKPVPVRLDEDRATLPGAAARGSRR